MSENSDLMPIRRAAAVTGIGRGRIKSMIARGLIPVVSRSYLGAFIHISDIQDAIARESVIPDGWVRSKDAIKLLKISSATFVLLVRYYQISMREIVYHERQQKIYLKTEVLRAADDIQSRREQGVGLPVKAPKHPRQPPEEPPDPQHEKLIRNMTEWRRKYERSRVINQWDQTARSQKFEKDYARYQLGVQRGIQRLKEQREKEKEA